MMDQAAASADILENTREKMVKAVEHSLSEFASFRTGRATSSLIERLTVSYYGSEVPLQQIAGFSVPDARTLMVTPYDRNALGAIEKAIMGSDLGITPSNDGVVIRLSFPPLTEERRKELVKLVKQRAEDGKVAIRNLRRAARHELEGHEKQGDLTSGDLERSEKDLEKMTAERIAELDKALILKEKELLEL